MEGSTELWEDDPAGMGRALAEHDDIVRTVVAEQGGYTFSTAGDSFAVAFHTASDAVLAAIAIQRALAARPAEGPRIRVRIGVHVGEAVERGGDYFGPTLNRASRIADAGHGGQILLSDAARAAAPSISTRDLGDHRLKGVQGPVRVHQVLVDGLDTEFPRLRALDAPRVELPGPISRLVGRSAERAAIAEALEADRLVTLCGPGGAGKTTLAVVAAHDRAERAECSAVFVDLREVDDGVDAKRTVARTIGLDGPDAGGELRDVLVVLDNCEHLVASLAPLVSGLLDALAGLRLLATSREPLELPGERVIGVPVLPIEDAVALFVDRAAPGREEEAETIEVLCERLDRLPLAIELAAARTRSLSVREVDRLLEDRFHALDGTGRRRRHGGRTLEETVSWSYELLEADEQDALCRLSTLHGEFDLELAAAVLGTDSLDALDVVDSLVARSLVEHRAAVDRGRSHYRLLETIRAFAAQRLAASGREVEAKQRWADAVAAYVYGDRMGIASARSVLRRADVAAAERFLAGLPGASDAGPVLRVIRGNHALFDGRSDEGRQILVPLLDEAMPTRVRILALTSLSWLVGLDGDFPTGHAYVDEAIALDPRSSEALWASVSLAIAFGGLDEAQARRDLRVLEAACDVPGTESLAHAVRAALAAWHDDAEEVILHATRAREANPAGLFHPSVTGLLLLGFARSDHPERVLARLEEPGALDPSLGYQSWGDGHSFRIEANMAASVAVGATGAEERARRHLSDALALADERSAFPRRDETAIAVGCATALLRSGHVSDARALCASIDVPGPGVGPGMTHLLADIDGVSDADRPTWVRTEPFVRIVSNTDELRATRRRLIERAADDLGLRG
ncbi:MAG: adenylate/guanylate cyclase domain-containing protein [Acidimicrobiales bacterium]|nr:adenylate/guanylate cyclase domain-containing protein [Acidimicrobiales bacterium]